MAMNLGSGERIIGHTRSGESGSDEVVVADFDETGVVVTWPRAIDMFEALEMNESPHIIDPLILRDDGGWLTLSEGDNLGATASSLGHSKQRVRYLRAIATGAHGADFARLNGMSSEVDGLAKWAGLSPVHTELNRGDEHGRGRSVSVIAQDVDPIPLGGELGLTLAAAYSHNPTPRDGKFTISTWLQVHTRSAEPVKWTEHMRAHRMIQDLMCLVYGRPCLARLRSVMRDDDQDRKPSGDQRLWRAAYEPGFGRNGSGVKGIRDSDEPLFHMSEADAARVSSWLDDSEYWSRPTWIAVTTLFHHSLPIESQLLQVAVALEALGYAIAKRNRPEANPSPNFVPLLKEVVGVLGHAPAAVFGHDTTDEWCKAFNNVYKGVKHADHDLPDSVAAWHKVREGLLLIRCWLAAELGVPSTIVEQRLNDPRVAS